MDGTRRWQSLMQMCVGAVAVVRRRTVTGPVTAAPVGHLWHVALLVVPASASGTTHWHALCPSPCPPSHRGHGAHVVNLNFTGTLQLNAAVAQMPPMPLAWVTMPVPLGYQNHLPVDSKTVP